MTTIIIGFIIIVLVSFVVTLFACMRSSQISQQQDYLELQKQWEKLAERCKEETINDIELLR
jgi:acid phosphatase class B